MSLDHMRTSSGATFYREDQGGKPVGVVIPSWREGFEREVRLEKDYVDCFFFGTKDQQGEFEYAFVNPSPGALRNLGKVATLEWLIYLGNEPSRTRQRSREEAQRSSWVVRAAGQLPKLQAVLMYDTRMSEETFHQLTLCPRLEVVLLLECQITSKEGMHRIRKLVIDNRKRREGQVNRNGKDLVSRNGGKAEPGVRPRDPSRTMPR